MERTQVKQQEQLTLIASRSVTGLNRKRNCESTRSRSRRLANVLTLIENKLYAEFKNMRKECKSVKRWWLNSRVKQLVQELIQLMKI